MNSTPIRKTVQSIQSGATFTQALKQALPETTWPWVFAALRQERLVWESLQGELGRRALDRTNPRPEDFSPGSLALLAAGAPGLLGMLRATLEPVEGNLRQRAARVGKAFAAAGVNAGQPALTFVQAGLLALHLRERRAALDAWEGLAGELAHTPPVVLACLYGMIPDAQELLLTLVQAGGPPSLPLQALLSNPLPPEAQSAVLKILLERAPLDARRRLLHSLAALRPALATPLAQSLLAAPDPDPVQDGTVGGDGDGALAELRAIRKALVESEDYALAGQHEQQIGVLEQAQRIAGRLQATLSALNARAAASNGDPQAAQAAWQAAANLDPSSCTYRHELAYSLLQAGRPADAQALLDAAAGSPDGNPDESAATPFQLYIQARLASFAGDRQAARGYTSQAAGACLHGAAFPDSQVGAVAAWPAEQGGFLGELARLLIELDQPTEAAQVAHLASEQQPAWPGALHLLSQAQAQPGAGGLAEAVEAAHLAVALAPGRSDYRRQLAKSLEAQGDWESALVERATLLARQGGEVEAGSQADDLRALARCALKADRPEQAVQACQQAWHVQPDHGITCCLLGQALAAQGEAGAALEHLQQATSLAPDQSEPWLALAGWYAQGGQPQKSLKTLQTATRAAPGSPEVHLALGEAFLEQNAPTQALSILRRAADLAHGLAISGEVVSQHGLAGRIALRLGQTLHRLGHLPEARQVLEGAYRAAPEDPERAYAYAQTLLSLGQSRAALPPLETALAAKPGEPEPYLEYARSLLALAGTHPGCQPDGAQGETGAPGAASQPVIPVQKAIAPLRRVLELDPDRAEAKGLLAEALAASDELLPAMEAFRQALESSLAQQPAWQTRLSLGLGRVALQLGQIETAIAALQEANAAEPLNPHIQRTLSEAYDAAGLVENAFQSARAAILLAPEDLDVLTWFADQALELRSRPGLAPSLAQTEAINALNRAATLAPERTDLLVRLGLVQMQAGESQAACNTFRKLAAQQREAPVPERQIADLYRTAKYLLRLKDANGAIASLELALQTNRRRSDWNAAADSLNGPTLLDLLADLAAARYQAGQPEAALDALEQAIVVAPEEAGLFLDKADLHLEMSQPRPLAEDQPEMGAEEVREAHIQAARACLETALQLNPRDPALHQRAALIQRAAGDLPAALAQAERALAASAPAASADGEKDGQLDSGSNDHPAPGWDLTARGLAGDLARAQFQFDAAREYVHPEMPAAGAFDTDDRVDYYCLRVELALEAGDLLYAADDLGAVLDLAAEHPRVLALQARLAARRGDLEVARQMLRDAVATLEPGKGAPLTDNRPAKSATNRSQERADSRNDNHPEGIRGIGLLNARARQLNNQVAIAEAAIDLQQWETGLQLLSSAAAAAPQEPYIYLRYARALALRAEAQSLCQDLDVIRHAPGEAALQAEAAGQFEAAIQSAAHGLARWATGGSQSDVGQAALGRWRGRGQAAFHPSPESAEALSRLPLNPEDVAARVACLRKVGNLPAAGLAARAYPQHPRVLIQLALALAEGKPRQALAAAHAAVELVARPENSLRPEALPGGDQAGRLDSPLRATASRKADLPLVHYLLARLVHACGNRAGDDAVAIQAIGAALAAWPDEPRWHILAAEIQAGSAASNETTDWPPVIDHLEQSIRLEPKRAAHHLALGQAHLHSGESQRAIEPLEQAARLAPDLAEPWLLLAQAYRSLDDLEQAAAKAERAVTLAPEAVAPLLLRGEIALAANSPRGALSRAQAALHLNPGDPAAQLLLARALRGLNRPDEALEVLDKALPEIHTPLPFQLERARLLLASKSQAAALEALQELANQYPSEPAVLALLAECLAGSGQREAAIQVAQRALRTVQDGAASQTPQEHASVHLLAGQLLRKAGQLDSAIHHLSEAIQHAPTLVEAYLELGHSHLERRQFNQALSAYQQATAIHPGDPRGFYHAGLVFKESKDYLSAESMLRKAANLAPEDLSIHRLLAAVVALNLVHNRRESVREPQLNA